MSKMSQREKRKLRWKRREGASSVRIDFQGRWRPIVPSTPTTLTLSPHHRPHTHIQMHVHVERHTYTTPALRHYPSSSWNSRSMKWSSLLPLLSHSLSLSLPLSFSISRFHSVFVAHTLSVTVSAHSPSRYFRKIKGDKGER